jgi:hypothetical protein
LRLTFTPGVFSPATPELPFQWWWQPLCLHHSWCVLAPQVWVLRLCGISKLLEAIFYLVFFSAVVILEIGSHFLPRQAWTTVLCHCWDNHTPPCPAFIYWDRVWQSFLFFAHAGLFEHDPSDLSLPCSLGWHVRETVPNYWMRWGLSDFLCGLPWNYGPPNVSLPNS